MTINQADRLRKALPREYTRGAMGNFYDQLIRLLSQIATSTDSGDGGGDTTIINEAESSILSTVSDIQDIYSRIDDIERRESQESLFDRVDDLERQLIDVWSGSETGFKSVAVDAGTHQATDREFITAGLNAVILLPVRPVSNSVIIVKKIDNSAKIQIGGSGRKIDGHDSILIRRKNTALTMQYDITRDEWFIR